MAGNLDPDVLADLKRRTAKQKKDAEKKPVEKKPAPKKEVPVKKEKKPKLSERAQKEARKVVASQPVQKSDKRLLGFGYDGLGSLVEQQTIQDENGTHKELVGKKTKLTSVRVPVVLLDYARQRMQEVTDLPASQTTQSAVPNTKVVELLILSLIPDPRQRDALRILLLNDRDNQSEHVTGDLTPVSQNKYARILRALTNENGEKHLTPEEAIEKSQVELKNQQQLLQRLTRKVNADQQESMQTLLALESMIAWIFAERSSLYQGEYPEDKQDVGSLLVDDVTRSITNTADSHGKTMYDSKKQKGHRR